MEEKQIKRKGRLPNDGREYKTCLGCEVEFPISTFPQATQNGYKIYRSRCRICYNMYCMNLPKRDYQKTLPIDRRCKSCDITKPLNDFYSAGRGYYRYECKECYDKKKTEEKKPQREKYNSLDRIRKNELRLDAIKAYGGKCVCCDEEEEIFLTFDHVFDDGQAHRKVAGTGPRLYRWLRDHGYPDTIQLLCWNCNWAKSRRGGCPHRKGVSLKNGTK